MSERILLATRKGLLQLHKNGGWSIARASFPGVAVTAALHDARDGTLYAMLKHGHFGSKLHRSDDDGKTWTELPAPAFPPTPRVRQRCFRYGHSKPAEPMSRDSYGLARCRPGYSARTTAASIGNWSARCGMCRSVKNGLAVAMTTPAFIRYCRIHVTPGICSSRSPAAACGSRPIAEKAGSCAAMA